MRSNKTSLTNILATTYQKHLFIYKYYVNSKSVLKLSNSKVKYTLLVIEVKLTAILNFKHRKIKFGQNFEFKSPNSLKTVVILSTYRWKLTNIFFNNTAVYTISCF